MQKKRVDCSEKYNTVETQEENNKYDVSARRRNNRNIGKGLKNAIIGKELWGLGQFSDVKQ